MQDVAAAVGVRAPSLYRRFKDRASIVHAVELDAWAELTALLEEAVIANAPEATLRAQAHVVRRFATRSPNSYSLLLDIRSPDTEEGALVRTTALAPMVPSFAALVGQERAIAAARVLIPFLHGFISMELAHAFRLADGVDVAFENGVAVILRGLAQSMPD